MNYLDWCMSIYEDIIKRSKTRILCDYFEKHHIKPKSIFPELTNDKSNIAILTAIEHFICHWLLYEIYKLKDDIVNRDKMTCAWFRISYPTKDRHITSKEYELARKALAESHAGTNLWNNGEEAILSRECPGNEWIKGRLSKGKIHWWNNGNECKLSEKCPGNGWVRRHASKLF